GTNAGELPGPRPPPRERADSRRHCPRSQPRRSVRARSWRQSESHDHEWSECRADARHRSLILDGSDEALRTSTFPTFINVVHEPRPLRLGTSKAHRPVAFVAVGFFGKGSWRS